MTIKRLDKGPRMSQVVIHGNVAYFAGQVGVAGASIQDQTKVMLEKLEDLMEKAGTSKSKLLTATIWLADMGDFAQMNEIWDAWIDAENPPTRACGESKLATPGYKVEIIATAALDR